MTLKYQEPIHLEEPRQVQDYTDLISQVAADHQPVILRRGGDDLAAVISLEHLEFLLDILALQEAERVTGLLDWDWLVKMYPPPQSWFDGDEPKPF